MFINPIKNGYWTSKFGYRTHPITGKKQSRHQGIDIARQPNTNVEVLAAADGEVIRVGYIESYGNVVIIKHSINGKRMDTNYAHLASMKVKKGDMVKQGQVIGIMGNTGDSTAPHLHFEIHNGSYEPKQPNAVNPELYIKFYSKGELAKMEQRIKDLEEEVKAVNNSLSNLIDTLEKTAVYTSNEKASDYASGALKWATDFKILRGDTSGNLNPHGALKRQDMAVILRSYHDKVSK